jgi:hypothetical protein
MDVGEFEKHLFWLIDAFLNGELTYPDFENAFYWNGYHAADAPSEELPEPTGEFFDDVSERMDYTGEPLTAQDREWNYIDFAEFRCWLRRNLDSYRAGTYVAGNPFIS